MHICHLTLGHTPYDDRIYYKECWGLREWANRITVVGKEAPKPEIRYPEIGVHTFPWGTLPERIRQTYALAREVQADLYHLHEPELLPVIPWLKRSTGAAVVYDMHEPLAEVIRDFSDNPRYHRYATAAVSGGLERLLLALPDGVVFTSRPLKHELGKYARASTIVYNFPRTDLFPMDPSPDPEEFVVLYHGQIAPARGILELVAGFYLFYRQHQHGKLRLVGPYHSETFRRQLEQTCHRYRIVHAVELEESVPHAEVPELLRNASVGIMALLPTPAFRKSVQIKTFEYMSAGLPVIAGNYPSARQFPGSRKAGLVLEETTPRAIADALGYLYTHPEQRRKIGLRGQRAVREKWNWSHMNRRLQRFYESILNSRPLRRIESAK